MPDSLPQRELQLVPRYPHGPALELPGVGVPRPAFQDELLLLAVYTNDAVAFALELAIPQALASARLVFAIVFEAHLRIGYRQHTELVAESVGPIARQRLRRLEPALEVCPTAWAGELDYSLSE